MKSRVDMLIMNLTRHEDTSRHHKRRRRLWKEEFRGAKDGPAGAEVKNLISFGIFLLSISHFALAAASTRTQTYQQQQQNQKQPQFAEPDTAGNVQRVVVGRPVKFKCVVSDIGEHKLAWFHKDKRLLLAFDNSTVAWKERIQVSSLANSVFFLSIDSVQLSDKGQYSCQLNTQPAKSQSHILDVVKSPSIREEGTSHSIEPVKEFSAAELRCAADGIPKPTIKWRRESQMHLIPPIAHDQEEGEAEEEADGSSNMVETETGPKRKSLEAPEGSQNRSGGLPAVLAEGELLRFERVTRLDMGFYICIASNEVPPSVSQRIFLPVSFAPTPSSTMTTGKPIRKPIGSLSRASTSAGATAAIRSAKNHTTTVGSTTTSVNATAPRKSTRKHGAFFEAADRNLADRRRQQVAAASSQQAAPSSNAGKSKNQTAPLSILVIYSNIFLISYMVLLHQHKQKLKQLVNTLNEATPRLEPQLCSSGRIM